MPLGFDILPSICLGSFNNKEENMGSKEFQELAMNAVFQVNPNIAISEMFVVWMVKVLQNNKALISAMSTDNYYEVTYNGDKKELYVDEYIKNTNTCLNVNEAL
jgi:hypothetical protein